MSANQSMALFLMVLFGLPAAAFLWLIPNIDDSPPSTLRKASAIIVGVLFVLPGLIALWLKGVLG